MAEKLDLAPSRKVALVDALAKGINDYSKGEKEKALAAQKLDADRFRAMMPFLQTLEKEKGAFARSLAGIEAKAEEGERTRSQAMAQFMETMGFKQKELAQEQTQFQEGLTEKRTQFEQEHVLNMEKVRGDFLEISNKLTIAREGFDSAEAIVQYKADTEALLERLKADIEVELKRIDQAFATGEREAGQVFTKEEREATQEFTKGESALDRTVEENRVDIERDKLAFAQTGALTEEERTTLADFETVQKNLDTSRQYFDWTVSTSKGKDIKHSAAVAYRQAALQYNAAVDDINSMKAERGRSLINKVPVPQTSFKRGIIDKFEFELEQPKSSQFTVVRDYFLGKDYEEALSDYEYAVSTQKGKPGDTLSNEEWIEIRKLIEGLKK